MRRLHSSILVLVLVFIFDAQHVRQHSASKEESGTLQKQLTKMMLGRVWFHRKRKSAVPTGDAVHDELFSVPHGVASGKRFCRLMVSQRQNEINKIRMDKLNEIFQHPAVTGRFVNSRLQE